jgi:hypothetical protein
MESRERGIELSVGGPGIGFKQVALVLGLVFVVTLAVMVGRQMSSEATAVVIGIICGVAAGIPTSMLLLVALTRRDRRKEEESKRQSKRNQYPPVVVIQGGGAQGLPQYPQGSYWPSPAPGPAVDRQFQVVGDDDLLLGGGG